MNSDIVFPGDPEIPVSDGMIEVGENWYKEMSPFITKQNASLLVGSMVTTIYRSMEYKRREEIVGAPVGPKGGWK